MNKKYEVNLEVVYKRNIEIEAENIEEAKEIVDDMVTKTNVFGAKNNEVADTVNVDIRSENYTENDEDFDEIDTENYDDYEEECPQKNCEDCEHWCSICNECILGED